MEITGKRSSAREEEERRGGRGSGCVVWRSRTGRCEALRAELLEAGTHSRRHEISHDVLAAPLAGTPATIGPPDIELSSPLSSAANDRGRSIYAGFTIICLSPNSKRGFIELKMQQKTPFEIQKLQRSTLKRHPPPRDTLPLSSSSYESFLRVSFRLSYAP